MTAEPEPNGTWVDRLLARPGRVDLADEEFDRLFDRQHAGRRVEISNAGSTWQLQEAKNRLSEVIRKAKVGPQQITVHGRPAAYIVSVEDFEEMIGEPEPNGAWVDRLLALPARHEFTNEEIDDLFGRIDGPEREAPDFSGAD